MTDDLSHRELKGFTELAEELLCGKRISAVTVGYELKTGRKFVFEVPESHTHCKDAWANAPVIRDLVSKDRTPDGIHDQPDIAFFAPGLDIGLIRNKGITRRIIVIINERLDTYSGSLAVVGDLLVGYRDVIEVFKSLTCLTKRKLKVDTQCQTK